MHKRADQLSRLQEEHVKGIKVSGEKIQKWELFIKDYEALQARLSTLPAQLTHDIMVPFGRFAFAPGKLYHSNEVTLLIGDNWFLKTTVKHALDVVQRRKDYVVEQLKREQQILSESQSRWSFTEQFQSTAQVEQGGTVEIKEEFTPPTTNQRTTPPSCREKVRKAWVPKGNVPPPRKVFPPSRKGPGPKLEPVTEASSTISEYTKAISPLRIIVSHGAATNDDTKNSSWEATNQSGPEVPLYSSPADIPAQSVSDDPSSSVQGGQIPSRPEQSTSDERRVKWASEPNTCVELAGNVQHGTARPFTGQVIERTHPQAVMATDVEPKKRMSKFKSTRAKK